jgi:hypothetical protein
MFDSNGAFSTGPSAGPSAGPDISAIARVHGVAAIKRLVEILDGTDVRASIEAARIILDRGYGAPSQPLVFDTNGIAVEVSAGDERPRANGKDAGGHTAWET